MTPQLIVLLVIIVAALTIFIGGWLRVDLVGLLVLSALALTSLVTPQQALAGFSSSAVVTVWAMFILSAGLTRTGVAHQIGLPLQRFAKSSEALLIAALMITAAVLSALINTVTVAAILLPATLDLARRSGRSPSRLLLPLALGGLLGGPFTLISTPPNMLAAEALTQAGLRSFGLLDFTPITAVVVGGGILFVVLLGRHLLPTRVTASESDPLRALDASYQLDKHTFALRIPPGSLLDGRTLAESRLGSALHLTVLALQRKGVLIHAPRASNVLQVGDVLVVHGHPRHLQNFHGSQHFHLEPVEGLEKLICGQLAVAEARVPEGSSLLGVTLAEADLRPKHRVQVLVLQNEAGVDTSLALRHRFAVGDRLVLQGQRDRIESLAAKGVVGELSWLPEESRCALVKSRGSLLALRVPNSSVLVGRTLVETRLGGVFGLTVLSIVRGEETTLLPLPHERVMAGDLLVIQGERRDLEVIEALEELQLTEPDAALRADIESQQAGITEVMLSPRTGIAGRTLSELLFRDHYGISVLAIWRKGRAYRTELQDLPLEFGDALLVYGPRSGLEAVARNPDFLVLDESAASAPRLHRAPLAAILMLATVLSAILGYVPIAIAAVTGAALMVLSGCLSMEEAYRAIEWKVIFLIACMIPLGVAVEQSGAAQMAAEALIGAVGGLGPRWVVAALFLITMIGTQIIPTAALVVLMAPVALTTAARLDLSPQLLMMTVAMSASASFASPISHPAHLLVMGPGGYRFTDYLKVGIPLSLIAMALCVWLLPVLWPA